MTSTTKKLQLCLLALLLFSLFCLSRPKGDLESALDNVLDDLASHLITNVANLSWTLSSVGPASSAPISPPDVSSLDPQYLLKLCGLLSGKRVLLVGPETTYHLHSIWLNSLEHQEQRSHHCLGRDYCNFHHICRPAFAQEGDPKEPFVRKKKIPSPATMALDNSSLLQYSFSTTLYASTNKEDAAYIFPQVDQYTQIRRANLFWRRQAKKADIIVMSRAPLPSPASTYPHGNWTFARTLCSDVNYLAPVDCGETLEHTLVNAAIHVTVNDFFPGLVDTFRALSLDLQVQKFLLLWHSTWYMQPSCTSVAVPKSIPLLQNIPSGKKHDFVDPWTYYYNVQVYIHHRLLPNLLPYFNIKYVSLMTPNHSEPTYMRFFHFGSAPIPPQGKDCIRYPWRGFDKDLENVFLGGLNRILEAKKSEGHM